MYATNLFSDLKVLQNKIIYSILTLLFGNKYFLYTKIHILWISIVHEPYTSDISNQKRYFTNNFIVKHVYNILLY